MGEEKSLDQLGLDTPDFLGIGKLARPSDMKDQKVQPVCGIGAAYGAWRQEGRIAGERSLVDLRAQVRWQARAYLGGELVGEKGGIAKGHARGLRRTGFVLKDRHQHDTAAQPATP